MVVTAVGAVSAQMRDYAIHERGMMRQTIYNTGEIGRAYDQGAAGSVRGIPSMEWPARSETIIDATLHHGQYNSFGGGVYVAGTRTDTAATLISWCGGINETVTGRFTFPMSVRRSENYPVLPDGSLNPGYNPQEAEEIIISQWGTSNGFTVTRTSRVWSLPDYDDMILYEYEFEYTGNVDGDPSTIETTLPLNDALFGFAYGFGPSMLGYERKFKRWNAADFQALDQFPRFDRTRWMNYNLDRDGKPDPLYYMEWASSQKNGGGLLSPQAVGFLPLYYDTLHLARKGETAMQVLSSDTANVWDDHLHVKQPFLNRMETSLLSIAKMTPYLDMGQQRKNNPYRDLGAFGPDWVGRGSYNWRQSQKFGVGHIMVFGPYTMRIGDKVRFAVAEVAGYGAARLAETEAGLKDEGGSCGELCGEATTTATNAFNPVPNWSKPITYGGVDGLMYTHGSTYLNSFPLPQYVNSGVVTVREVADRAIQLYTGQPLLDYDSTQFWPERSPDKGVYLIPLVVPAPGIKVGNTSQAENRIVWSPAVESFTSPSLRAPFSHYEVQKATHPLGPWQRLDSVGRADPRYYKSGTYELIDRATRVGEAFYYAILSVDQQGNKSGRTNIKLHQTQLGGTESLGQVVVVPNPFVVRSGFAGTTSTGGDAGSKVGFYNLPRTCTIRIVSYSGQLVETLVHDTELYSTEYFQVTRNNQVMASGIYFYIVETPDGQRTHGKFVIIH
jgi:hypothetical protein